MYTVILSPEAFRVIIASTLEAYAAPHGRNHDVVKHTPLETVGAIWGYKTERDGNEYFHITAADVDTSAHRANGHVTSKPSAIKIKRGFYQEYSPELSYLGDFHSHPWSQGEMNVATAQNVERQRLYRFSGDPAKNTDDFKSVSWLKSQKFPYKVGVVATMYRMTNVVENKLHAFLDTKSAFRFTYTGDDVTGNKKSFRCWVKVYVFPDDTTCIPAPDSQVKLHCSALGFFP
jgi:hypothetical protein